MFAKAKEENRKIFFLGIGYPSSEIPLTNLDVRTLKESPLITCRDNNCKNAMDNRNINSHLMVCPAFFASKNQEIRKGMKIGCVFQNDKIVNHKIDSALKNSCFNLYNNLKADIICHFINEYIYCRRHTSSNVRYAYDAIDYFDIYNDYDVIISTRLHGAILAMSMGIPTILICRGNNIHKRRLVGAGNQFPHLKIASPNQIKNVLKDFDIESISRSLIEFKQEKKKIYKQILDEKFYISPASPLKPSAFGAFI